MATVRVTYSYEPHLSSNYLILLSLSPAARARTPGIASPAWRADRAAEPEQVQGPRRERTGGGWVGLRWREGGHGTADAERRA